MRTLIIFSIIFFTIVLALYPIIRIIYFLTSKKTKQNKLVNILILLVINMGVLVFAKIYVNDIYKYMSNIILVKNFLNILIIFFAIIAGGIIETFFNSVLNFFVKRRNKKRNSEK
ncbi:MAG: hypothetical protein LBL91_04925 [Lachnospiraceae bacterium]|jgi:hypothetical protein|nr:hypothetical protein [Lachnospiraceae bacterium]